jgi:hypothetical protein
MQISDLKASTYWRKSYSVEAIRLTPDNMMAIADFLGAEYCTKAKSEPFINNGGDEGHVGEWLVREGEGYLFYFHEDFSREFWTHSEKLASDEKYARVFQLVSAAMSAQASATYHQDTDGMDLVAIKTAKKIIEEL